jgi:rubrerythrin
MDLEKSRHKGRFKKMFLMSDIIDLVIQIEVNAENIYRNALMKISNPSLVTILKWLADEEVEHAAWFRRLRATTDHRITDPEVEAMGKSLLSDVLGKQSFSLKEADFSNMSRLTDLLSLAIEFENDKILFYKMLRPFIDDNATIDFLEKIIAEETHHVAELLKLMDRVAEEEKIKSET